MSDRDVFEARLTRAFAAYADAAPVEVDPVDLATGIAAVAAPSTSRLLPRDQRLVFALAAALLVAAFASAVLIASRPTPLPVGSTQLAIADTNESHCMSIDRVAVVERGVSSIVSCSEWLSLDPGGRWATERYLDPSGDTVILDRIDLRTGARREVTRSTGRGIIPGAISPDGRFVTWDWCTTITFPAECGGTAIADLSASTPEIIDLGEGIYSLRWSPDGRRLAIEDADGAVIADRDGSLPRRLDFPDGRRGSVVAWSPDMTQVLTGGDPGLAIVDRDGAGVRRISDLDAYRANGWWSPDGRAIALVRTNVHSGAGSGAAAEFWIIETDGTGERRIDLGQGCTPLLETLTPRSTPRLDCRDAVQPMLGRGAPAWSPDGRRFAVPLGRVGVDDLDPVAIAIWNADTGDITRIEGAGAPAWSPDGTELMVVTAEGIDVVAADGSARRQVLAAPGPIDSRWGVWIPDEPS